MTERTTTASGVPLTGGAALLLLGFGGVGSAYGQAAAEVTVDLAECVALESAEQRFACYEARVKAVLDERDAAAADESADDAGETPQSPLTRAESAEAAAESDAGRAARSRDTGIRRRSSAEEPDGGRTAADENESDSVQFFGTITALHETVPNSYLITLDNGQVWRQARPKWYPLRPGLEVRIYPTRWGSSYRLTAVDGGGYIQVQRAR